jgi:mRNA interferase RelE/StbE
LWNKLWINLCWFKKIYFANKKYRIVYKIIKEEITIYIISIWKREDMKVYKDAYNRLKNL